MKRFRSILFWCHLGVAVPIALVVLLMAVTGTLLTYQRQLTSWADLRGLDGAAPSAGAQRLPLTTLLAGIPARGEAQPTAITLRAGADAPVQVAFGRERVVFVNAYSGRVLGEGSAGVRAFFRVVTDWHRWLGRPEASRPIGKMITGAANLGFLFLVLSGMYLWWPRNITRQTLRGALWFRRGLSGKARDFNWHHAIGFWCALPLFVVVLSGVVISYRWAGNLVYAVAGEAPPAPADGGGGGKAEPSLDGVDPLLARAAQQLPAWRTIALQVPKAGADSVRLTLDGGSGGQPQARALLVLDRRTAAVLKWEPFAAQTPGRRARSILRFAHTGEVLGLLGQTVAGLASLGAAFLVWTGLALSWRRLGAWRRTAGEGGRRNGEVRGERPSRAARRPARLP